ncbi:hypothetical protein ACWIUA_00365 [Ursidibacter sp. B-7004-1]
MSKIVIEVGKSFRMADGSKATIFADLRQVIEGGDHFGFHFFGGYVFEGQFYECRWNEQGQSDRTNYRGFLEAPWQE